MKHSFAKPIIIGLCFFLCGLATVFAAEPQDEIERLQKRLAQLDSVEENLQNKPLKEAYQEALKALQDKKQYANLADQYTRQIESHPKLVDDLKRQLDQLGKQKPIDLQGKELDQLDQLLALQNAELLSLQSQQSQIQSQLDQLKPRALSARSELSKLKAELEKLSAESITPGPSAENGLSEALNLKKSKQREALIAHIKVLELELLSIPQRTEIASLEWELNNTRMQRLKTEIQAIQARVQTLRQEESAKAVAEVRKLSQNGDAIHPALTWLAEQNEQFSTDLQEFIARTKAMAGKAEAVEQHHKIISQSYWLIKQQLEVSSRQNLLGERLRQQLKQLPRPINTTDTESLLEQARIRALMLDQHKLELTDLNSYVQSLLSRFHQPSGPMSQEDLQKAMQPLIRLRSELINKLQDSNQAYIEKLSVLLSLQNQLNDKVRQFDTLLRENLLWVPSARPLDKGWFEEIPDAVRRVAKPENWQQLLQALYQHIFLLIFIFFLFIALKLFQAFMVLPRCSALEKQAVAHYGRVNQDSVHYPFVLLIGAVLSALPWPVFLELVSQLFRHDQGAGEFVQALAYGLHVLAIGLFITGLLSQFSKPDGLLITQFRWPKPIVTAFSQDIHRYAWIVLLCAFAIAMTDSLQDEIFRNSIGRLFFILSCITVALFAMNWLGIGRRRELLADLAAHFWSHPRYWALFIGLEQLVMIAMAALGYYFGALYLKILIIASALWLFAMAFSYCFIQRWLLIEQRRIAYAQAKAKRAEIVALRQEPSKPENAVELIDENYIDLQAISAQSKTLLKMTVLTFALLGIGWIWLDTLPALALLDKVQLWGATEVTQEGEQLQMITLKTLLYSALLLSLVIIAARNLPGMLELLVLQRLELSKGSRYALTTLLKYFIVAAGILIAFNNIGMPWSKLQWLVAALGVGLGFGLQEIFANFVSGLIILFEKPIRIGDTVTLDTVSGTVTRIHIRATTITDWDRKEIVIPNKTFITQQLINWSLTDPITRLVIPVGIAYGSDTELAHRLLLEAAKENPLVLDDPEPSSFFLGFGDSSLKFDLRVFVGNISNRLQAAHELHNSINRKFNEHGIEIAFPQLDIHMKKDLAAVHYEKSFRPSVKTVS